MQQTAHIRSVSHSATLHYPPDPPPHIASIITGGLEEGTAVAGGGGQCLYPCIYSPFLLSLCSTLQKLSGSLLV